MRASPSRPTSRSKQAASGIRLRRLNSRASGIRTARLLTGLLLVLGYALLTGGGSAQEPANSQEPILVSNDWELVPDGIGPGEQFRLLFVTKDKRHSQVRVIDSFNKFVQDQAKLSGAALPALIPYASRFRVVGSTATVSARANTATTGNGGVPIYWVKGDKVADNYGDFYDGSWDSEVARDQAGKPIAKDNNGRVWVYTGSTSAGQSDANNPLGPFKNAAERDANPKPVRMGTLYGNDPSKYTPLRSTDLPPGAWDRGHFYALSPVFQTKPGVRVVKHPSELTTFTEGYAGFQDTGVLSQIEMVPPSPDSTASVTIRLTDDATSDFLAPTVEEPHTITVGTNPTSGYGFGTQPDRYTALGGTISLAITEAPEGYEIVGGPVFWTVKDDPDINYPLVTVSTYEFGTGHTITEVTEGQNIRFFTVTVEPWEGDDPDNRGEAIFISAIATEEGGDFVGPYRSSYYAGDSLRTIKVLEESGIFAPSPTVQKEAVATQVDSSNDNSGSVTFTVLPGVGYRTEEGTGSATVTVKNNPDATGRDLRVSDISVNEGDEAVFTLETDRAPVEGSRFVLAWGGNDDTASGEDWEIPNPELLTFNWPAGQTSVSLSVNTKQDNLYESDEFFQITLSEAEGIGIPSGEVTVTATIVDDDPYPVMSLSSPTASEGGQLTFSAKLSNPSGQKISVRYKDTGDGTAQSGVRYTALPSGKLTFAPGDTEKTIVVDVLSDQVTQKADETVILRLSRPRNVALEGEGRTLEAAGIIRRDSSLLPEVRISEDVLPVHEGDPAVFHAEVLVDGKVAPWDKDITIQLQSFAGTATADQDFPAEVFQTVIPAGDVRSPPIEVPTHKDTEDEGPETLGLYIISSSIERLPGAVEHDFDHKVFATIYDGVSVLVQDAPETAEGKVMEFTVDLGAPAVDDVVFTWKTEDGTATAGADYTAVTNGQVTIPAGEESATISVTTLQDTIDEPRQTLDVVLAKTSGTAQEVRLRATGVIRDDDRRPLLSIADVSVNEGGTARFQAKLAAISEKDVTGDWETVDGTAIAGVDYEEGRGTFTIAAGSLTADISVVTTDDDLDEVNERFRVVLSHAPGTTYTAGGGVGTIVDNDGIKISISDTKVSEPVSRNSSTEMTFVVRLSSPAKTPITVQWKTQPGTGEHPAETGGATQLGQNDYTAVAPMTLTFSKGEQSKDIAVQVHYDTAVEWDETVHVVLENPTGASIADGTGIGTILDRERVDYWIDSSTTEIPEGESLVVRVHRSRGALESPANRPCLLEDGGTATPSNQATAFVGGDDVHLNGRHNFENDCVVHREVGEFQLIHFQRGELEATFTIYTVQDDLAEGDETFTVWSGADQGTFALEDWFRQQFTIIDDESRRLRVERREGKLWEGGKATYDLYVEPALPTGETLSVNLSTSNGTAIAGQDYTTQTDTVVNLGPPPSRGEPAATVEVLTIDNEVIEAEETFTVTFHSPSPGLQMPAFDGGIFLETIHDDDRGVISLIDTVVDEGGQARVTLELSRQIDGYATVTWETVSGDAKSPSDFTAVSSGSVTIRAGATSATLVVTTTQDTVDEPDEDFEVRITSITPANFQIGSASSVTIRDDDHPTLDLSGITDSSIPENEVWVMPAVGGQPFGKLTWTLGGDDADLFRIDPDTGRPMLPAQDFEAPADHDTDNVYELTLRAVDEDGTAGTTAITVTVTNVVYGGFYHQNFTKEENEGEVKTFSLEYRPRPGTSYKHGTLSWRLVLGTGVRSADSSDFTGPISGTVQATSDSPVVTFSVEFARDDLDELFEDRYRVEMFHAGGDVNFFAKGGNKVPPPRTSSNSIVDVDDTPSFSVADVVADEGEALSFTVTRAGASKNEVSVKWSTDLSTGDKAASTGDFTHTAVAQTLNFAAGEKTKTVTVATTEDSLDEDDEIFEFRLSDPAKAAGDPGGDPTITRATAIGTITDDDDMPVVSIADATATEGTAVSFTIRLDAVSGRDVKVKWNTADDSSEGADQATADTDYTAVAATEVTIAAGSTTATVTVNTTEDVIDEPEETFVVQLTSPTNATVSGTAGEATGTITDDDVAPTAITLTVDADTSVDDAQNGVVEGGGTKTALVTATVDGSTTFGADTIVTVKVGDTGDTAISGTDYTPVDDLTIKIPAGQRSGFAHFRLIPTDDSLDERIETLSLVGSSGTLTFTNTQIRIADDDDPPVVSIGAATATEGGSVSFTISLDAESGLAVKVKWKTADHTDGTNQATANVDYTAQALTDVIIAAGSTSTTVTVATKEDAIDEPDETFLVQLSAPAGILSPTASTATGTITDDDDPPVLSIADASAIEGGGVSFTISLDVVSGRAVKVKWATADHTGGTHQATADTDYTSQALTEITISAGSMSETVTVQ
ncbi:MAG: hypothetical protein F4194_09805, partial [Acidimicrobiia bacterium]|nr:hypothetical protein [Acidimicrobiia bacterium]